MQPRAKKKQADRVTTYLEHEEQDFYDGIDACATAIIVLNVNIVMKMLKTELIAMTLKYN